MAVSMLRLSRPSPQSKANGSHTYGGSMEELHSFRKPGAPQPHYLLYQGNGINGASGFSLSGGFKREERQKRGHESSQRPLLMAVASSVPEIKKSPNFLQAVYEGAVAGATAGVVVEAALYPIDTIKTRLQASQLRGKTLFEGLYSGLAGNLVGVLPASAVFVGVYEPVKRTLLNIFPDHLSALAHLAAGVAGGTISSLIRVPTEVVKQRMQMGQFASAQGAVHQIVAQEGVGGLYAGFGSFLLRDLPFDAFQFCIYEQLKIGYSRHAGREINDPEAALMGAIAGAITGTVTTPLDVIKTRLMIQGVNGQYKGIADCITKIIKEEGASTLLQGVGPRILWIGLGGSIFFGVLEKTKELLERPSSKAVIQPAGFA